jgi:tRNA (cytidine/uridine-2'-O-)-methyltransferase
MFSIVLLHPEIPPNTGNIIRMCANTGCTLHLVEPMGFRWEDAALRRAGLDYHEYAEVHRHPDFEACRQAIAVDASRWFALTTKGSVRPTDVALRPGDVFLFGCESSGLPAERLAEFPASRRLRLPMRPGQRSLNLSNAAAVLVFEAWRQNGFAGAGDC